MESDIKRNRTGIFPEEKRIRKLHDSFVKNAFKFGVFGLQSDLMKPKKSYRNVFVLSA